MKSTRFTAVLLALCTLFTACGTQPEPAPQAVSTAAPASTAQPAESLTGSPAPAEHPAKTETTSAPDQTTSAGEDTRTDGSGTEQPAADPQTDPGTAASSQSAASAAKTTVSETSAATTAATTAATLPETTVPAPEPDTVQAVFLGISGWGNISKANAEHFTYRFDVDGQEKLFRLATGEAQGFALQNLLKENYHFSVTADGDTVTAVQETETGLPAYTPPVSGTPGMQTVRNFLKTAMEPVGTALYVYGGGWNWQDTGSAVQTRSIGVSPDWVRFFREHDASYTFRDTLRSASPESYYPEGGINQYYYAGLDCSGYVGWAVYNVFHTVNGEEGYVGKATEMAKRFAGYGWGEWTHTVPMPDGTPGTAMQPGDIMSMSGHVWISLGTCADGSIVIAHSTRSNSHAGRPGGGVQIGAVGYSEKCQAYQLANTYMHQYFPEWCARYPVSLKSPGSYLAAGSETAGRFRWNDTTLSDPDGIRSMSANDALALIFS